MNAENDSCFPRDYIRGTRGEGAVLPDTDWYAASKVVIDMVVALVLLALTWPIILLLMVLVKVTSRGTALYTQKRLGLDGQPYTIYKIRTMEHDCERSTGPVWSGTRDPRVMPLGRFLRRCHLDELPQLWNVVRGEMSLVGPRPERPEFVRLLERVIPGYRERLRVRPGITGLAQIQLPPDENLEAVHRKVAHDVYYVRQMGPWLDLRILAGTGLKVLGVSFEVTRRVLRLPVPADNAWANRAPQVDGNGEEGSLPRLMTITT